MSEIETSTSVERETLELETTLAQPRRRLAWGTKWAGIQIGWQFLVKLGRGLVIPKLLAPAEYGLYTSLGVLLSYSQYADLGVKYQMGKRLPYELGRGGDKAYRELAGQGGTWILATSLLVALGLLVAAFFQHGEHAWFYRPALMLLALLVVLTKMRDFLGTALLSREEYKQVAIGAMVVDGVALVCSITFLLLAGVLGAVVALLASELAGVLYLWRHVGFRVVRIQFHATWQMVREGVLLLGVALMDTALMTVDQLFLLKFFSKEQFGIYSLGLFVCSVALSISGILLTAIQPRVMGLEGEGRRSRVHRLVDSSVTLYALALVGFLIVALPSVSVVVRFYLPKYQAGIPTYVILAGIALVRGPAILLRPFYFSRNQEKRLLGFQFLALALAALLDAAVVVRHLGISYVAMASFGGYLVVSGLMLWEFERLGEGAATLGKYVTLLAGAVGVVGMYLFFATNHFPARFWAYAAHSFSAAGVYFLLMGLVVLLIRRPLVRAAQPFFSE